MNLPSTPRILPDAAILRALHHGGLLDDIDCARFALRAGKLRAAGLDVFEREPIPADDPILTLDNVVLSPHVAWLTTETLQRSLVVAVENCRQLRDGAALLHRVT